MKNRTPPNTVQRVLELMEQRNLNLYQLSQLSGVSHSTLRTTKARGGQLTVDTVFRICEGLGITMEEFFKESA